MSFGREMKDFVAGFGAGVDVVGKAQSNKIRWEKGRQPTDKDLADIPDMENTGEFAIPEVSGSRATEPGEIESYIRETAARYNIDPDVAVRVAQSEGGLEDPYRQGDAILKYGREESYGPFQLHMRMNGVGERALAEGIDPRKDWKAGVDYALREASQKGWGQWFGAAKAGVGNFAGIGGPRRGPSLPGETAVASSKPSRREAAQATEVATPVIPETEGAAPPALDTEVSFDLPDAPMPELTDWSEFLRRGQPTLMAERGGVIPHYATGGGAVDPYNPHRAMTQAIPQPGGTGFVPRRVGQPSPMASLPAGEPTPSQIALRNARAAAAVPPPAAPAQQPINMTRLQEYDAMMGHLQSLARPEGAGQPTNQRSGGDSGDTIYTPRTVNRAAISRYNQFATPEAKQAFLSGTDPTDAYASRWLTQYRKDPGQRWDRMGPGAFVKGLSRYFAKGGIVEVDPEYWEAAVRRERGAPGGGGEQEARDRAARRINRERRGVESSAIRIGRRGEEARATSRERTERRRGSAGARLPASAPAPTSRPGTTVERDVGSPSTAAVVQDDRATRFRRGDLPVGASVDRPGRLSDEYVLPSPADVPVDLPGVVGTGTGRVSDEYVVPDRPGYLRRLMVEGAEPLIDFRAIAEDYMSRGGEPDPEVMPGRVVSPPMDLAPGPVFSTPAAMMQQPSPDDVRAGGWTGRQLPDRTLEDRVTRQLPIQPAPQQTVVRPPINDRGRVMQSTGQGVLSPVARPWFIERDGVLYQIDPRTMEWTPAPVQDPTAAFARGGVIPDPAEPLHGRRPEEYAPDARTAPPRVQTGPGQNETAAEPQESVKPTRKLMDHVAQALDGGVRFLTRHFGLGKEGAVPSPGDASRNQEGVMRFASGEGQATPEEIQEIDNVVDPDRQLDEGNRHMTRLAKMTQWYLMRGRKDDAEASAASLMQYGAHRFGQLGHLAGAAYRKYQETGDPQHLESTTKFLEQAYRMIPDGGNLDVSLNKGTGQLAVTRMGPDGEETTYDLGPQDLQNLVRTAMNGSTYWNQVFRMADPEGARSLDINRRQERQAQLTQQRQFERDDRNEERRLAREDRIEDRKIAAEDRRHKETLAAEDRRAAAEQSRYERNQGDKKGRIDWSVISPLRAAAEAARSSMGDNDDPKLQADFNQKASELFDALGKMTKDPAKAMEDMGILPDDYQYVVKETPPAPNARKAPDGNWYVPDPSRPGKYLIVEGV